MSVADQNQESFQEYKRSFFYGKRTDLNFKFLSHLSDDDAAQFLQEFLWKTVDAIDTNRFDDVLDHIRTWQCRAYQQSVNWEYTDGPFVSLSKDTASARIALVTSSGHFVAGDEPSIFTTANMTQAEVVARIDQFLKSAPVFSTIPKSTPAANLRVRHAGYDTRGAEKDPNTVFPLERLKEFVQEGIIGDLADEAWSFMGACAQLPLLKTVGPKLADTIRKKHIDAVILVPV